MADITVTSANVKPWENATLEDGVAAESITAGDSLYLDSNDELRKAYNQYADTSECVGIAMNSATRKQKVQYATGGDIDFGGAQTVGVLLMLSGNAGKVCPHTDVISGDYPCVIGSHVETRRCRLSLKQWPEPN